MFFRLATVERFVSLRWATHGDHSRIFQDVAQPLENEPCRLLADSQITRKPHTKTPFLQLTSSHIAGSHLVSDIGLSSNIVPTFTENCLRHW